jgi:hypothetical protein
MAVTVKKVVLWRREVDNKPGMLAATLEPLAAAGADLHIVMGYRYPGNESRAAIEMYPIVGKKATTAAHAAGLTASSIPTLLVEGDNRAGLGAAMAKALADAGINLSFLVAQVIGRKYSALFGFETAQEASKAATLMKRATIAKKAVSKSKAVTKKKEMRKTRSTPQPPARVQAVPQGFAPSGTAMPAHPA